MRFYVASFEFEGPGVLPNGLKSEPGVFLLLQELDDDQYELLDFGHFENVKKSWLSVDFRHFQEGFPGQVSLAIHYCDDAASRHIVIAAIRKEYAQIFETQSEKRAVVSPRAS